MGKAIVIASGKGGTGKTMLAKCFPSILPTMTFEEALEVTKIHSIAGVLDNKVGIITSRPFRAPHHTATTVALPGPFANTTPSALTVTTSSFREAKLKPSSCFSGSAIIVRGSEVPFLIERAGIEI